MSTSPVALRIPLSPPQAVTETDATLWPAACCEGVRGDAPDDCEDGRAAVILAHGAGTDQTETVLRTIAGGLAAAGHPVLTFNFAYAQAARRRPDPAPRLLAAWRDVISAARDRLGRGGVRGAAPDGPGRPLVLGGRSMGGRMASLLVSQGEPCAGLLLLGYPLHPAGRPEQLRTAHWRDLRVPILFVQGDRDVLCRPDLLARERAAHLRHVRSDLHVVAGGDHGFRVGNRVHDSVLEAIVRVTARWLSTLTSPGAR